MALLRAETVTLRRGGRTLLEAWNATVKAGDRRVIMGPSGSGKTSLLRALARLDPFEGQLSLRGVPADRIAPPAWRAAVTWVAAETALTPGTVESALRAPFAFSAVSGVYDHERSRRLMKALGLEGLEWHRSTEALSAGQRQRLALARALSIEPAVLLADEPTAHLDAQARDLVLSALKKFSEQRDRAVVVVAHDPAVVDGLHASVWHLGASSPGADGMGQGAA